MGLRSGEIGGNRRKTGGNCWGKWGTGGDFQSGRDSFLSRLCRRQERSSNICCQYLPAMRERGRKHLVESVEWVASA